MIYTKHMNAEKIVAAYQSASKRLLLLDYDGVLAPIMPTPEQAAPTEKTYDLLKKLITDTHNTCVIISGRPHETLEQWFGQLPLAFAAEHGLWRKELGGKWQFALKVVTAWKPEIYKLMNRYVAVLPGAFIEEKHAGLAFHYRVVENADAAIEKLIIELQKPMTRLGLQLIHGKKVVEIMPAGVDKGAAAMFWLEAEKWDFVLGVGDDTTDEALFKVLPPSAVSIKVGSGITAAQTTLPSQPAFIELLTQCSGYRGF